VERRIYATENIGFKVVTISLSAALIQITERLILPTIINKYNLLENDSNNRSSHSAAVDLTKLYHGRAIPYFVIISAAISKVKLNPSIAQIPYDSTVSRIEDNTTSPKPS
jgi:hypothetical protein